MPGVRRLRALVRYIVARPNQRVWNAMRTGSGGALGSNGTSQAEPCSGRRCSGSSSPIRKPAISRPSKSQRSAGPLKLERLVGVQPLRAAGARDDLQHAATVVGAHLGLAGWSCSTWRMSWASALSVSMV